MKAGPIRIRPGRLPDEAPILKRFIDELQAVEHAVEPDRRIDDAVVDEYYAELMRTVAARDGRVFVADTGAAVVGWLVTLVIEDAIYVRTEDRTHGYFAELFVVPEFRRGGVARALFAAAEADFLARGLRTLEIGVLAGNTRARAAYEALGYRLYSSAMRKRL